MTTANDSTLDGLIHGVAAGEPAALGSLFERYRPRLLRMVDLHINRRLQRHVSAKDVLDAAFQDMTDQLEEYASEPRLTPFLWMRKVAAERLAQAHAEHFPDVDNAEGTKVALHRGRLPQASSMALASKLIGRHTPGQDEATRAERQMELQAVLNLMSPEDREVLAMRHFEQLSSKEVATILEVSEMEAGMRFLRALRRLKDDLKQSPDFTSPSE